MTLYLDTDIVHKLAAFDLLEDAVLALGYSADEVAVLCTAKFRLFVAKKPEKGVRKFGRDVHARITRLLKAVREAPQAPHPEDMALMQEVLGIDEGEAILFSHTSREQESVMATGDKRSLEALASAKSCTEVAAKLKGRIFCLEQIMLKVLDSVEFDDLREKVVSASTIDIGAIDKTMASVFGSGPLAQKHLVRSGFASYVRDLRGKTGDLLTPEP